MKTLIIKNSPWIVLTTYCSFMMIYAMAQGKWFIGFFIMFAILSDAFYKVRQEIKRTDKINGWKS